MWLTMINHLTALIPISHSLIIKCFSFSPVRVCVLGWQKGKTGNNKQTRDSLDTISFTELTPPPPYIVHFFARLNLNKGLYCNHVPVFIVWVIWYLNKLNQCYLATTSLKNIIIKIVVRILCIINPDRIMHNNQIVVHYTAIVVLTYWNCLLCSECAFMNNIFTVQANVIY